MSQTETKTIVLPSGKEAVLKAWMTAREGAALREIPFRHAKMGSSSDMGPGGAIMQRPSLKEIDLAAMNRETDELLLRTFLVEFDGSGEAPYERVMDGPDSDYVFLLAEAKRTAGLEENPTTGK